MEDVLLSNRYLIYTVRNQSLTNNNNNYIIYDFLDKRLITDRPQITTLISSTNGRITPDPGSIIHFLWHGDDRLFLIYRGVCNLWDLESDQVYYVEFDVSNPFTKNVFPSIYYILYMVLIDSQ